MNCPNDPKSDDKLNQLQMKFHLAKALELEREYQRMKSMMERKLWELEEEYKMKLERLSLQIQEHRKKVDFYSGRTKSE